MRERASAEEFVVDAACRGVPAGADGLLALGDLVDLLVVGEDPEGAGRDGVVDHVGDRSGLEGVRRHPLGHRLELHPFLIADRLAGCILEGLGAVPFGGIDVGADEPRTQARHADGGFHLAEFRMEGFGGKI